MIRERETIEEGVMIREKETIKKEGTVREKTVHHVNRETSENDDTCIYLLSNISSI